MRIGWAFYFVTNINVLLSLHQIFNVLLSLHQINSRLSYHLLELSGPLKNAIDWASRPPNVWANKPAAIISAGGSFGGGRSQYHLRQVGVYLDLHFVNKPELFVKVYEPPVKFDSQGNLIDPEIRERLKQVLLSLRAFTHKQQSRT